MPTSSAYFFDPVDLAKIAEEHAPGYSTATPFPHTVIDDFVPEWVLETCIADFPGPKDDNWALYTDQGNTLKLATEGEQQLPTFLRQLIAQLNGGTFITFLERLTGIAGLVPDPHLVGGGLHQIERGGFLKVHADFNLHPRLRLDRRVNLLLYLNEAWEEEWGGALELHDAGGCRRSIFPIANRVVVFNTTDNALHGHPEPLACPPGRSRRSIALYYYTAGRPETERAPAHSTLYQGQHQPSQIEQPSTWKQRVAPWVPAAVLDAYRRRRS